MVKTLWMDSESQTNPHMTMKADSAMVANPRSTLVIKSKKLSTTPTADSARKTCMPRRRVRKLRRPSAIINGNSAARPKT